VSSVLCNCNAAEPLVVSVSIHSGIESVLSSGLCGGGASAVCSQHGLLSAGCYRLSVTATTCQTVSTLYMTKYSTTLNEMSMVLQSFIVCYGKEAENR